MTSAERTFMHDLFMNGRLEVVSARMNYGNDTSKRLVNSGLIKMVQNGAKGWWYQLSPQGRRFKSQVIGSGFHAIEEYKKSQEVTNG